MKFDIRHCQSGAVLFTADIESDETASLGKRIGQAVFGRQKEWLKNKSSPLLIPLAEADFREMQLSHFHGNIAADGANLAGAQLENCDFSSSSFAKATFRGTELGCCRFPEADLEGADFSSANCIEVDFGNSHLAGAKFRYATLASCRFDGTPMHDADFSGAEIDDWCLGHFKSDVWASLMQQMHHVPKLVASLIDGTFDGTGKNVSASCVFSATSRGAPNRPADQWFSLISLGGKAGDIHSGAGWAATKALQWCKEWSELQLASSSSR